MMSVMNMMLVMTFNSGADNDDDDAGASDDDAGADDDATIKS